MPGGEVVQGAGRAEARAACRDRPAGQGGQSRPATRDNSSVRPRRARRGGGGLSRRAATEHRPARVAMGVSLGAGMLVCMCAGAGAAAARSGETAV
jgi:hypothetical protein